MPRTDDSALLTLLTSVTALATALVTLVVKLWTKRRRKPPPTENKPCD